MPARLEKYEPLALADRALTAFGAQLRKTSRTKHFTYRQMTFVSPDKDSLSICGYLIAPYAPTMIRSGHDPFAVGLAVQPDHRQRLMLFVCRLSEIERGTNRPPLRAWERRVEIAPKKDSARERARRDTNVAKFALVGLQYGDFTPDIIQKIGSLGTP